MLKFSIDKLEVDNFKSLNDFEIELEKNTFIIGLNGTGKSTILQVVDFISAIASGKIEEWLNLREWNSKDLVRYKSPKHTISCIIDFQINNFKYKWDFSFNKNSLQCTKEEIHKEERRLLKVDRKKYIMDGVAKDIEFKYEGSILSALEEKNIDEELLLIKNMFLNIRSIELLSPILMKKRAKKANKHIGIGGQMLSAYIHSLDENHKIELKKKLNSFFGNIDDIETSTLQAGWKKLILKEKYTDIIETDSQHLSDGTLRILAILAQLDSDDSILLFDEIEDGINQEFVELLLNIIISSNHQTIITTHSPILLNFLDSDTAKKSVKFIYKDQDGNTRVVNFFDYMENPKELNIFGPGEIMNSINLIELSQKLNGK